MRERMRTELYTDHETMVSIQCRSPIIVVAPANNDSRLHSSTSFFILVEFHF